MWSTLWRLSSCTRLAPLAILLSGAALCANVFLWTSLKSGSPKMLMLGESKTKGKNPSILNAYKNCRKYLNITDHQIVENHHRLHNTSQTPPVCNEASWEFFRSRSKGTPSHLQATNRNASLENLDISQAVEENIHQLGVLCNRGKRLVQTCQLLGESRWPRSPKRDALLLNKEHRLLYCPVQKVGSSFWKRVFKILNWSSGEHNKTVLSMSGMSAHSGLGGSRLKTQLGIGEDGCHVLETLTSFIFTRDPFSRLLSGFLDKIFLPNPLGEGYRRRIVAASSQNRTVASMSGCFDDISFAEFCKFVADALHSGKALDPHFAPIHTHCDPCRTGYHLLGKMETFMADAKAILGVSGVDFKVISGGLEDFDHENELSIIRDLIKRTSRFTKRRKTSCLSRMDVFERMWLTFQTRGFIPMSHPLPYELLEDADSNATLQTFETLATAATKLMSKSRQQRLHQRDRLVVDAFRSVPVLTLERLASAFSVDCDLFDYSCNITQRFLVKKNEPG